MNINISCSYTGCSEPVIGQCSGYKGACGQFYCAKHSSDKLCHECASRKACDDEAIRRYDDYLAEAKRIGSMSKGWYVFGMWIAAYCALGGICGLMGLLAGFAKDSQVGQIIIVTILGLGGAFLLFSWLPSKKKRIEQNVIEVDKIKPGFAEFHKVYTREKASNALALTGAIAIGLFAAGVYAGIGDRHTRIENKLGRIEDELHRML